MRRFTYNLAFVVTLLFAANYCSADRSYSVKSRKVLCSDNELGNSVVQIHAGSDGNIIVLLNKYTKREMDLFTLYQGNWKNEIKTFSAFANGVLFKEQEQTVFCTLETQIKSGKKTGSRISFYKLQREPWNLSTPYKRLNVDYKEKVFSGSGLDTDTIYSLPDRPQQYILLGSCTERKWDPLNILGTILSGGHSGYDRKPFVAEINNEQVVSYFLWPRNLESNEVVSLSLPYISSDECHLVGTVIKEYKNYLMKIEYAGFNFETNKWTKPTVIYQETRKGEYNGFVLGGRPQILATETQLFIAWSLLKDDLLGPGVFIRTKMNQKWKETKRISDSGDHPLLKKNTNGTPYLFWHESGKGFFCSYLQDQDWSLPCNIVEEQHLSKYGLVWDVNIDNNGDLHIIYLKSTSGKENIISHDYDLIYMLLQKNSFKEMAL